MVGHSSVYFFTQIVPLPLYPDVCTIVKPVVIIIINHKPKDYLYFLIISRNPISLNQSSFQLLGGDNYEFNTMFGKASVPDHFQPELIDHQLLS